MAKLGLSIGIDADVTGLRKLGQQVTGELEKLRGITNRIGSSINAAMSLPIVSFVSSVAQANAEARKIRSELLAPFSTSMMQASVRAEMAKMQFAQRMVAQGLDTVDARKIETDANKEMLTALMAQSPTNTAARSIESFISEPSAFLGNLVRAAGGYATGAQAELNELFSGNLGFLTSGTFNDPRNKAAAELGRTQMQAGMALAMNDVGQLGPLLSQLERQTYVLQQIDRNTQGQR
jgi:hypothetical protein